MLNNPDVNSRIYNDTLNTYLHQNPQLQTLINPIYHCYYGSDGPGNFGTNLKVSHVDYRNFTPEGLEKLLELKRMNVPLIRTQNAFRTFIRDTPVSTRGIALVYDHFMSGGNTYDPIYAVAYEKGHDCDKLYLYDTDVVAGMIKNHFKPFFRENFCLFYPDKKHRVYNQFPSHDTEAIENASVLEDIAILYAQRDKAISIPSFMSFFSSHTPPTVTKNTNMAMASFSLSPVFDYSEPDIRREHLCELIKQNEAGLLFDDKASSSPPR